MPPQNNGVVVYLTGNEVMAILTFVTTTVGAISTALWVRLNKKDDAFTDILKGQIESTIKQNSGLEALTEALKGLSQTSNENYKEVKSQLDSLRTLLESSRRG